MEKLMILFLFFSGLFFSSCKKEKSHPTASSDPFIVSVWPETGDSTTIVTILGRNFSDSREDNLVKFNGKEAIVLEASDAQLQVVVPSGAGNGAVTVTVNNKEAEGPVFTYKTVTQAYYVSTVAGNGVKGFVDGNSAAAEFNGPEGLATDADGNVIVVDMTNNSLRKIIINESRVMTIAGNGEPGFVNGPVALARFKSPWKAAVGPGGDIFIADRDNFMIRKISVNGEVSTIAGDGYAGHKDGAGETAEFKQPLDVALDVKGNIYVADNTGQRIRKITPDGIVSTLAGSGNKGYTDGTGTNAAFNYPSGIAVDAAGNVIVADRLNNRIRLVTPEGKVSTIAGNGNAGYKDGDALSSEFSQPYGVAVGPEGNIFVADLGNQMIREISTNGTVSTVAGSSQGYADGPGKDAAFSSPTDVAVDNNGNIYVADKGNQRIRKIISVR
jgi:sugar lactone lactonase YvrE